VLAATLIRLNEYSLWSTYTDIPNVILTPHHALTPHHGGHYFVDVNTGNFRATVCSNSDSRSCRLSNSVETRDRQTDRNIRARAVFFVHTTVWRTPEMDVRFLLIMAARMVMMMFSVLVSRLWRHTFFRNVDIYLRNYTTPKPTISPSSPKDVLFSCILPISFPGNVRFFKDNFTWLKDN
jgi:hypothetical protein